MPEISNRVLGTIAIEPRREPPSAPPRTAADEDATLAGTLVRLARDPRAIDLPTRDATAGRCSARWQEDRLSMGSDRLATGVVVHADLGCLEGELSAEAERVLRRLLSE